MAHTVTVPLPLNFLKEEGDLYIPYQTYISPVQKTKKLKNTFVAFTGFCVTSNGLIKECHHDNPVQYQDYLSEATWYYYDAVDNPENLITLDDNLTYLVLHHPWFNYYHWVCESIFRLWMVRNKLPQLTLILPEFYKDADFITGSLEPFNIEKIFYIPQGKSLLIKNVCLPQIKPVCDSYNAKQIRQVRNFYRDYVINKKKFDVPVIEKLYMSRKLASRRKVVNEDEIEAIVKKFEFTIFHPEKYCFLEQVTIFSHVKFLVCEHGSGTTNMLFMDKNTSVLELHKNRTNELNHPSFLFWYMADALGINYYHQSCATVGREDYFEGDYFIDPNLFEKNLNLMIYKNTGIKD